MTNLQFKKTTLTTVLATSALLASVQPAWAQEESSGPETSISIALKQDIFFGFHGISQVGVSLSDLLDVTFYGILWTRPGFGARGGGADLWTEWGAGVNIKLLDGNLGINPQFGLLNGTLLSGSERGLALEGIVPNLTVTYGDGLIEGQIYVGFYIGTRTNRNSANNDFIHFWGNVGASMLPWLSGGVHFEQLIQTRGLDESTDLYQWLGPYIEAKGGPGFIRFSAGVDLTPDDPADFYQITTGVSL